MPTKTVKLAVLTSGVDAALKSLTALSSSKRELGDKPTAIRMNLDGADLTAGKLEELSAKCKEMSDKGVDVRVRVTGAATSAAEFDAISAKMDTLSSSGAKVSGNLKNVEKDAEKSGKGSGSKFLSGITSALGLGGGAAMGWAAAGAAIAGGLAFAVKQGMNLQSVQAQLGNAMKNAGESFGKNSGQIDSFAGSQAKFGESTSTVEQALTKLEPITGSVAAGEKLAGDAANVAAAKHVDFGTALDQVAKLAAGTPRALKQMGDVSVTGATQAKANAAANQLLGDRISQAGGMAKFAAANHMSLKQAQDLVSGATKGNIDDFNKLGIEVLPKSATAAEKAAQAHNLLAKYQGAASTQSKTLSGFMAATKASFEDVAEKLGMKLIPGLTRVVTAIMDFAQSPGFKSILASLGLIIDQVGKWIGAFLKSAVFKDMLKVIGDAFKILGDVIKLVADILTGKWSKAWADVKKLCSDVVKFIDDELHLVWAEVKVVWDAVAKVFKAAWDLIKKLVMDAWHAITSFFSSEWSGFVNNWKRLGSDIWTALNNAWNAITGMVKGAWNAITGFFKSEFTGFVNNWKQLGSDVWSALSNGFTTIENGIHLVWNRITGFFSSFWAGIKNGFSTVVTDVQSLWGTIESVVKTPVEWIANNVWNKFADVVDAVTKFLSLGSPIPHLTLASGGRLSGYGGGDIVPALLEPGETVVSKEHSKILRPAFEAMGVPGYTNGGAVPGRGGALGAQNPSGGSPLSDIGNAIKDVVGDIGSFAKGLVLGGLKDAAAPLINGLLSVVSQLPGGSSGFGQVLEAVPKKFFGQVLNWIGGQDAKALAAAGSSGAIGFGIPPGGLNDVPSLVTYAKSFIGKVPYKWGGTSTAGWDCSGFTQYVYDHFGYGAPRTADDQYKWAKKSGASAGALAFFAGADGTTSAPGHVGIMVDGSTMVDAYGTGYGTRLDSVSAGGPSAGSAGNAAAGSGPVKALAQTMAAARGWTGAQWAALNSVEMAEAGWSMTATNSGSGAYGIAQGITGPAWYIANGGNANTAAGQITAMLNYIAGRYGTPSAAWAHEQADHWYANGGLITEPITGLGLISGDRYHFGENGTELVTPASGSYSQGGGDTNINITVNAGDCVDPNAVAQAIHQKLRRYKTKRGGSSLGL